MIHAKFFANIIRFKSYGFFNHLILNDTVWTQQFFTIRTNNYEEGARDGDPLELPGVLRVREGRESVDPLEPPAVLRVSNGESVDPLASPAVSRVREGELVDLLETPAVLRGEPVDPLETPGVLRVREGELVDPLETPAVLKVREGEPVNPLETPESERGGVGRDTSCVESDSESRPARDPRCVALPEMPHRAVDIHMFALYKPL